MARLRMWTAVSLVIGLGVTAGHARTEVETRVVPYTAREVGLTPFVLDPIARTSPLAPGYFFLRPAGSSFTLLVDDAAAADGETMWIAVHGPGITFHSCVSDGARTRFDGAVAGEEYRVSLDIADLDFFDAYDTWSGCDTGASAGSVTISG